VIDPSATVCIVEVMKLMNHVKAGVGGTVVAVYGENGVAVERGERLFAIVPDAAGSTD
jgi:biotin carboxyl carrier protein